MRMKAREPKVPRFSVVSVGISARKDLQTIAMMIWRSPSSTMLI